VTSSDSEAERTLVRECDSGGDGDGGAVYGTINEGTVESDTEDTDEERADSAYDLPLPERPMDGTVADNEPSEETERLRAVVLGTCRLGCCRGGRFDMGEIEPMEGKEAGCMVLASRELGGTRPGGVAVVEDMMDETDSLRRWLLDGR
jgi:hypothetical protein